MPIEKKRQHNQKTWGAIAPSKLVVLANEVAIAELLSYAAGCEPPESLSLAITWKNYQP